MSDPLTFLPSLRRGLAGAVGVTDDVDGGALAGGPSLTAWVEVEGRPADTTVRLLGPESVTAVAASQILRAEPRPDSTDVEPNYLPFVELATPDLPWMLTPARADGQGRVRPWLVLVVVREQEDVALAAQPGTALPVLTTPIAELPDLAESWAWAHVQSLVPVEEIAAALDDATGAVVARLVCPRRLLPDSAWLACVVPAFAAGRLRGLGQPVERGAALGAAWDVAGEGTIDLPVYYSWRFTTGAAGDFESLCRRLKPDGGAADVGRHPMEIGDPGLIPRAPRSVVVDMQGALETPGVASRPWDHPATFQRPITLLLNTAAARRADDLAGPDPVVAPPFYGSGPSGATAVPGGGWLRTVNDDPVARAAAGLGRAVVRADQEALVAAAWDQAGALQEATTALNQARLGAEVAASWKRRADRMDDVDLLQLSAPMHGFLRTGSTTIRRLIAGSALPAGLISPAYLRQSRPGTALARAWTAQPSAESGRLAADHAATTLAATRVHPDPDQVAAIHFADHAALAGAQVADPTLTDTTEPELAQPTEALQDEVTTLLHLHAERLPPQWQRRPRPPRPPRRVVARATVGSDVSGIAATVRQVLDPMSAVRAALVVRIPALDGLLDDGPVPTTLLLSPVFEDPLSEDLARLGAAWMLPGVESIVRNRVRLVAANPSFIGAFLVGANEELRRELLWRDYPVAPAATFFHRFWNYTGEPPRTDIGELAGWRRSLSIADNMARDASGEATVATVVVVRGDLVRRYPSAHYFLQEAELGADGASPRESAPAVEPIFLGALGPDTVFFGFDLEPDEVRGDRPHGVPGYFLAIEEQVAAPRLGMDEARPRHFTTLPKTWNGLSWGHLAASQEELDGLTHARADSPRLTAMGPLEGVTWGRNAAHLARACWQRPFRMYIHADTLV
jgi:hypothetical protein